MAYQEVIKDIPLEKIAYVDESGIDTYLYREYGYALRGQRVFGQVRGRKYQRCGIVAAQMGDRILAPFQYNGTMNSRLFEFWFSNHLLPSLEQGTVIVMDNASFHSKKAAAFCCPKCQVQTSLSSTLLPGTQSYRTFLGLAEALFEKNPSRCLFL